MTETYGVASIAELTFLGVRAPGSQPADAVPFVNFTCLANLPQSSVRLSPPARRYAGAVNMRLLGPLRKCGAQVWYSLDGSTSANSSVLPGGDHVRIRSDGAAGTMTSVRVRTFQEVQSGSSVFTSRVTAGSYDFPKSRLVPVCPLGTVVR